MACAVPLMSFLGNLLGVTTQAAFVQSMIVVFTGGKTGLSVVVTGAFNRYSSVQIIHRCAPEFRLYVVTATYQVHSRPEWFTVSYILAWVVQADTMLSKLLTFTTSRVILWSEFDAFRNRCELCFFQESSSS